MIKGLSNCLQRLAMSKFNSEFDGINSEVTALRTAHTHARTKANKGGRAVNQMQDTIERKVQEREVSCLWDHLLSSLSW